MQTVLYTTKVDIRTLVCIICERTCPTNWYTLKTTHGLQCFAWQSWHTVLLRLITQNSFITAASFSHSESKAHQAGPICTKRLMVQSRYTQTRYTRTHTQGEHVQSLTLRPIWRIREQGVRTGWGFRTQRRFSHVRDSIGFSFKVANEEPSEQRLLHVLAKGGDVFGNPLLAFSEKKRCALPRATTLGLQMW